MSGDEFQWPDPPRRGHGRTLRDLQAEEPDLFAIIDGTEQALERPSDDEREHRAFSKKRARTTCKNSLIVNEKGVIRGVTKSDLGRTHELTQIRQSGLLPQIPPEVVVLADAAYQGLDKDLPERTVVTMFRSQRHKPLQAAHDYMNRRLSSVRIIVENVICQLKHFQSLAQRFRHDVEHVHSATFAVVSMLVNHRIQRRIALANRA